MHKNIIFDLDGTLFDSMKYWKNVGRDFLIKKGISPREHLDEEIKKMPFVDICKFYIERYNLSISLKEVVAEIFSVVEDNYKYDVQLKPFALDYLKQEKEKGTKMCIATASERHYVQLALDRLQLNHYFAFITTCSEVGIGKEHADFFMRVSERLGSTPDETMVFEDSLHAIETAKNSGFYCVGVYDDYERNNVSAIKKVADQFIYSFNEI